METPIRIAAIMAGGAGERFWPLSRQARPKQLLRLTRKDMTLLEEAVQRIAPLIPPERILIATSRGLVEPIRAAGVGVPDENVIGEPDKRNTAGALAFAAAHALARFGDADVTMAVLTADHAIAPEATFRADVARALEAAESERALVTFGVAPSRPETGYGYIETGAELEGRPEVFRVAAFREKPDAATAERFAASGHHYWNSGMFFWPVRTFLDELEGSGAPHAAATLAMADALRAGDNSALEAVFGALPNISIDYALMEKATRVLMVRATFEWDDVGAWDALGRGMRPDDDASNVTVGDPVVIDSTGCIVYNEPGAERMAVSVVGAENLVVVVSQDGVLVMPRDRAQDVKLAVAELRRRGATQL